MLEWFKRHAWKACVLQKGTGGSNPFLSATNEADLIESASFVIIKVKPKAMIQCWM